MINNGLWKFPEQMGGKAHVGFIYLIYDRVLEKAYIGKKYYRGRGKQNKGDELPWKTYTSSSKIVKGLIGNNPIDEFDFIVLEQYATLGAVSFAETYSLCLVEAPCSDDWLNVRVEKITWKVTERVTDRHKERMQAVCDMMVGRSDGRYSYT